MLYLKKKVVDLQTVVSLHVQKIKSAILQMRNVERRSEKNISNFFWETRGKRKVGVLDKSLIV